MFKQYVTRLVALAKAGVRGERGLEDIKINQGRLIALAQRNEVSTNIQDYEFKVFSQFGEDGIVQRLVSLVPIAHRTFVEFGVEDFFESNCRYLMMKDSWKGFVIDGSEKSMERLRNSYFFWQNRLSYRTAFITRSTIDSLIQSSGFDPDLGILSIDVDGVDYWLLEAIESVTPRILILEYNALFGAERCVTVPYADNFVRSEAHYSHLYFGASLGALTGLAARKGYSLVGTNSAGNNAFYVRTDLMPQGLRALSAHEAYTEAKFRESRGPEGALTFLEPAGARDVIKGLPVINTETGATEEF